MARRQCNDSVLLRQTESIVGMGVIKPKSEIVNIDPEEDNDNEENENGVRGKKKKKKNVKQEQEADEDEDVEMVCDGDENVEENRPTIGRTKRKMTVLKVMKSARSGRVRSSFACSSS